MGLGVSGVGQVAAGGVPEALPGAPAFSAGLRGRLDEALGAVPSTEKPRTRHLGANGRPRFTNRLVLESSPYLRQHAHNPVNWYSWGDEAFEAARALGRPVFVSIGYSTCHWCHVMEEESFDNIETARYLNANFVAIKVDREVRPDVDAIYMSAVQSLTGSGGWPLNVWLTPEREPFYGGTYFPPENRYGRPGFPTLLRQIAGAWSGRRIRIQEAARALTSTVRARLEGVAPEASFEPQPEVLRRVLDLYARGFDAEWGGLGRGRKFPSSLPVRLLLRIHRRTGDVRALEMAVVTLERMAAGGIHDQIGGGFHRYATERRWRIPHFEKMLYDNARITMAFLEGWQVTGRADFSGVVRKTLDYVRREMVSPEGAFFSATDADSPAPGGESLEGYFFTWTPAEINVVLEKDDARAVRAYFGVTEAGELEGRSILHVARPLDEVANELEISPGELRARLERANEPLLRARARRAPPLLDDKVLVAWNGLMISAFAQAGHALDRDDDVETAARAAHFVLASMRENGRLRRVFRQGRASGAAFLEDYAFLIAGLLDLYEATADPQWLSEAIALQDVLESHHRAPTGGYFTTAEDHESLLARERPDFDGAEPSGNSVTLLNLLRLHELTTRDLYRVRAFELVSAFRPSLDSAPDRLAVLLAGIDFMLDAPKEVILVAPEQGADAEALLAQLRPVFLPNRVLVSVREGASLDAHADLVPLVRDKRALGGRPTAYVCEARVCDAPTSDPEQLARQLRKVRPLGP